ncbi:MAG: sialate O-acetylesterase, partial [Gammaproteobacteria bacterium]|nr:sialate O-acetylesterase [Gammaproteobacteria bacterium]
GNLIKLAQRLRSDANIDARGADARGDNAAIPFIVGTMSRGNDERGTFSDFSAEKQRVDDAHRNFPNLVPFAAVAIADDLVPPAYPCGQGSCIHFGAAAYRELGVRYYEALQSVISATN